jgi:hypothetical protein
VKYAGVSAGICCFVVGVTWKGLYKRDYRHDDVAVCYKQVAAIGTWLAAYAADWAGMLLLMCVAQYLPRCNMILVVEGGRITHQGTYAELMLQGVDLTKYSVPIQTDSEAAESSREGASSQPSQGSEHVDAAGRGAGDDATVQQTDSSTPTSKQVSDGNQQLAPADVQLDTADDDLLVFTQDKGSSQVITQHSSSASSILQTSPAPEEEQQLLQQVLSHKEADGKLVQVEERAVGQVTWGVYYSYLSAWGPKLLLPLALILGECVDGLCTHTS